MLAKYVKKNNLNIIFKHVVGPTCSKTNIPCELQSKHVAK